MSTNQITTENSSEKAKKYKQAMPSAILEIFTKINSLDLGKRSKVRVTMYALWLKVPCPEKERFPWISLHGMPGGIPVMISLGQPV